MPAQIATVEALNNLRAEIRAALREMLARIQPAPGWVSLPDAATQLGVSVGTIRRKVREGKIEDNGETGSVRKVRV